MLILRERLIFHLMVSLLTLDNVFADELTSDLSISQLENRLLEIDSELDGLADYSLRSGIGTVGFRSKDHPDPYHTEWIQIELGEATPVDQIVLAPTIWRDTKIGPQADGFPVAFKLIVGNGQRSNVVATYDAEDNLLPRVAPLSVSFPAVSATWMRIEATQLSPRIWDGRYILQLSEVLVFSGTENVALRETVKVSSNSKHRGRSRIKESLVDGFMPYELNAAHGEQSIAFMSPSGIGSQPTLSIDLGEVHTLNRIHLHTPELSDTVPQSSEPGQGIPKRLLIEGANRPDFSDATVLVEYHMKSIFDSGPIIMRRFPETGCRYIRLTATEPYINQGLHHGSQIGFAEIELFSKGRNVALGKPAKGNFKIHPDRSFSSLTDGRNLYGTILPIHDWMNELSRRHDFETARPLVADELLLHYEYQQVNLRRLGWLAGLLAAGIAITILIGRMLRMQQMTAIRERFAADLHDELGANIYTMGLLGEVALSSMNTPDRLKNVLHRNQELLTRTGTAVRQCINTQESYGLYENLPEVMERAARRILADIEYEITVEGEAFLKQLKPITRDDLRLFFKECLVNISRHADATTASAQLKANHKWLTLTVSDNGRGISDGADADIPPSLKRRARLLGAKISSTHTNNGGTSITLKLKMPWRVQTNKNIKP